MSKKSKKLASLVLGATLVGTAVTGCSSSSKSTGMAGCGSDHSKDGKTTGKSSCGSSGCGNIEK